MLMMKSTYFVQGENYCIYELRIHIGAEGSIVQTVGVIHPIYYLVAIL